jgi:hypothetical protein
VLPPRSRHLAVRSTRTRRWTERILSPPSWAFARMRTRGRHWQFGCLPGIFSAFPFGAVGVFWRRAYNKMFTTNVRAQACSGWTTTSSSRSSGRALFPATRGGAGLYGRLTDAKCLQLQVRCRPKNGLPTYRPLRRPYGRQWLPNAAKRAERLASPWRPPVVSLFALRIRPATPTASIGK